MNRLLALIIVVFSGIHCRLSAQEYTAPLMNNYALDSEKESRPVLRRTTPIELPLKEDFSSYESGPYPSDEWWIDSMVYINNHFTINHRNKGVATFDVLNRRGESYPTTNPNASIYCDSLTSYAIDLSSSSIGDSVYLSFEYLQKGLGFSPKVGDSLLVFFKDTLNGWQMVDYILPGTDISWRTKMIPLIHANYFYSAFQFRIVNRGTIGASSSHWHVDNIYMNKGRSYMDTSLEDVAFSLPPSNLLNDFTAMPFRHFNTDRAGFSEPSLRATEYNRSGSALPYATTISYTAVNAVSGVTYGSGTTSVALSPNMQQNTLFPTYSLAGLNPGPDGNLQVEHKYYLNSPSADFSKSNDSIRHIQTFGNYFAYDDGSAEQSYFLNLSPGAPGKIAIEYALYEPDTLRGIAIQFARQVPGSEYKEFYIQIYKSIEIGGSGGELLYEQSGNYPEFPTHIGNFWVYPLNEPVLMDAGIFYVVLMMPASGVSDSLMIGLDRNRTAGNHRYYNVLDTWETSTLEGALMVRPLVGGEVASSLPDIDEEDALTIYPNPACDFIYITAGQSDKIHTYSIYDISGKRIQTGEGNTLQAGIPLQSLPQGVYILDLESDRGHSYKRFIKSK